MIEIIIKGNTLLLKYLPYNPIHWIVEKFNNNDEIVLEKVFYFFKKNIFHNRSIKEDDSEVLFVIGKLDDDYWHIDREILRVDQNVFIHRDYTVKKQTFKSETGLSIFKEIFKVIQEDIWIGGSRTGAITIDTFNTLIKRFPSTSELKNYILARISSILKEFFLSTQDFEKKYEQFIFKKRKRYEASKNTVKNMTIRNIFKENEYKKYQAMHSVLKEMLNNPDKFDEKEWQNKITDVLLLLYPKYISVLTNVQIKDPYTSTNRYLDFLFIDTNGNTDIIEIKKPFLNCILRKTKYRDNFIPMMELSGAIMQIEKYIYYMNKWGIDGEKSITSKYRNILPNDIDIHITNPKGIVIMGRSKEFTAEENTDFEIIKRKYNNVIDILTYDDLINRVERIINYWYSVGIHFTGKNQEGNRPRPPGSGDQGIAQEKSAT